MPREQSYHAIIVKKQQYAEADEITTLFTREAGKVRVIAKSVKFPASKLQAALQPMFYTKLNVAGQGSLPIITGAQTMNVFARVREDPRRINFWFVIAELIQKALPDEQPNPDLFQLILDYLEFLNREQLTTQATTAGLLRFKIKFFELLGLDVHAPSDTGTFPDNLLFSSSHGGFYAGAPGTADSQPVSEATWQAFLALKKSSTFADLVALEALNEGNLSQLQQLLAEFVTYQIERELKAEKFLADMT